jgi:hypothetical protein
MINKKMIELMEWLKPYTPDERLEMLLEAARTTGIKELEQAIIEYWSDKDQEGTLRNDLQTPPSS